MPSDAPITIPELLSACPEAAEFSLRRIETVHDVVAHARTLAPMIGISTRSYEAAHERLGALRAAATVWAIMQFHDKIKAVGAYFRSITTGSKSEGFSPERLIRRLASAQKYAVWFQYCPRTIFQAASSALMNGRPLKGNMRCQVLRSIAAQILLRSEEMGQHPLIYIQFTTKLCRHITRAIQAHCLPQSPLSQIQHSRMVAKTRFSIKIYNYQCVSWTIRSTSHNSSLKKQLVRVLSCFAVRHYECSLAWS